MCTSHLSFIFLPKHKFLFDLVFLYTVNLNTSFKMPSRTQETLDIKIIGAGIAGLATALSLHTHKNPTLQYRITILESTSSLSEFGAGIQLNANATRIIYSLGLEKEFTEVANQPKLMQLLRYENDNIIGEIRQNPEQEYLYGFPHWQVYRPDFQKLLAEGVEKVKASLPADSEQRIQILYNQRVKTVDHETGTITFENGRTESADLVIAADGLRGRIRESIPGNEGIKARPFQEHCFRTVVPYEKMR